LCYFRRIDSVLNIAVFKLIAIEIFLMIISAILYFKRLLKSRTFLLFALGIILLQKNVAQFPQVLDSLSTKIKEFEAKPDFVATDTTYLKTLIHFGRAFRYTDNDKMFEIAQRLSTLLKEANYEKGIPHSEMLFGDFYRLNSQTDSAIVHYTKGIESIDSQEKIDLELKLRFLNILGYEYSNIGNYTNALSSYIQGIEIANKINNQLSLSFMYHNIANIQSSQNNFELAVKFYNKALEIIEPLNQDYFKAEILANLADTLIEDGKLNEAEPNLNKSIPVFIENNSSVWLAFAHSNFGKLKLKQENYNDTLKNYLKAYALNESAEDPDEKLTILKGISEAYYKLENSDKTIEYASENLKLSKTLNSLDGQVNANQFLSQTYEKLGDITNANFHMEQFEKLSKTLTVDQTERRIKLAKANQELEIEKILEPKNSKFEWITFKNFFILLLSLLLIRIVFLLFKQFKKT